MARPKTLLFSGRALGVGLGGGVVIGLAGWFGVRGIGAEVLRAGWTIPLILALHAAQLLLSAVAWRRVTGVRRPGLGTWLEIRWIREAVNSLLPVAQVGGSLVGVRLLVARGVGLALAGAGTTVDMTTEALAQFAFTLTGIATLAAIGSGHAWRLWVGGGLALTGLGVAGFVIAQRVGLLRLIEALADRLHRFVPALAADTLRGLHVELIRLQDARAVLAGATALHFLAWLLGAFETWVVLTAIGHLDTIVAAPALESLVIESLAMAARSAGFAIPGALGVQEGGFVLVCGLFDVPPDAAIALSMVKRLREVLVGVPGLLAWQWSESARQG